MEHFSLPTAQQLLASIAQGLRLDLDSRTYAMSTSTRKTLAAGERVKPDTRATFAFAVAEALNDAQLLTPTKRHDATAARQFHDPVARGLGEFAIAWDECVADSRTFNPAAARTPLSVLPLVRLGLADFGVRWASRSLGRRSYFLETDPLVASSALVEGSSFMAVVRHALSVGPSKRARLVDAFSEDTVRGWEDHALPINESLERLQKFFEEKCGLDAGLELDLRVAVALTELWRWLREIGIPDVACSKMAEGMLRWMQLVAALCVQSEITDDELIWTVLRGARNPFAKRRLENLSDRLADVGFARDLEVLGESWIPTMRIDTGPLADIPLAASDERAARTQDDPERLLGDQELLAVTLCLPTNHSFEAKSNASAHEPSAASLEAAGTAALNAGDFEAAATLLLRAVERDPSAAWPRVFLARALQHLGLFRDAEMHARMAITTDPSISDAHLVLGSVLIDTGRPSEAIVSLDEATKRGSPQPAVVCAYRAQALTAMNRFAEAVESCQRGVDLDPANVACWSGLAALHARTGNDREAKLAAKMLAHLGGSPSNTAFVAPVDPKSKR